MAAAVCSVSGYHVSVAVELYCFRGRSYHVRELANYVTTGIINGNLANQPFAKRERTRSFVCVVLSVGCT
jgi:hypothetical protein